MTAPTSAARKIRRELEPVPPVERWPRVPNPPGAVARGLAAGFGAVDEVGCAVTERADEWLR